MRAWKIWYSTTVPEPFTNPLQRFSKREFLDTLP